MEKHNRGLVYSSTESDINMDTENRLRVSDNSQIAEFDANTLATVAARECPTISTINIDKSVGVHIGPKIVSVVQNVDNNEKVKGRFLGLELVSLTKPRGRLRCSVAVFLCWAFIVAILLTIVIIYLILSATPQRLDIGLNETWYVRRNEWNAARDYDRELLDTPVENLIIGHTGASYCKGRYECIKEVQEIQRDHLARDFGDIGPHFVVGGGGYIFEGRGPNIFGAMVFGYNRIMIGVMFIGDYTTEETDELQIEHVQILINKLVEGNFLRRDYKLYGHCQVGDMISPDLPLPLYLVSVLKKTSTAERIACIISLIVLVVCISLIVYFVKSSSTEIPESDIAPDPWNITREMWLAQPYNKSDSLEKGELVRLVIINHSVSSECHTFRVCAAEIRNLQGYFIAKKDRDIPYNFMVGNDGRIYEGRGWHVVGAHTMYYNNCTLGVGFIGDYRATSNTHSYPSDAQIKRFKMLLEDGVKRGFLHPNYVIVGAKDIQVGNESPGDNLYNVMKQWDHFDNEKYNNLTCNQIKLGIDNNSRRIAEEEVLIT